MKFILLVLLAMMLGSCSTVGLSNDPAFVIATTENLKVATPITDESSLQSDTATPSPAIFQADLPDYGPAPELNNRVWVNTDGPLKLADLRGKVVLLEMWTFG